MYGDTLRDFILAMHNYDIVWLPTDTNYEPPF